MKIYMCERDDYMRGEEEGEREREREFKFSKI